MRYAHACVALKPPFKDRCRTPGAACCALLAVAAVSSAPARGDLIASGDVSPSNLGSWTGQTVSYVGKSGTGSITVNNGSDLVSQQSYVGYMSGAAGSVLVDGFDSSWTLNSSVSVGYAGIGTVAISNGGKITSSGCSIGTDGTVSIDGSGSTLSLSGALALSGTGTGKLLITNGGTFTSATGQLGSYAGSAARVSVDGAGSTWTSSHYIIVGQLGSGRLAITNGGTVYTKATYVAHMPGAVGSIDFGMNGGTLTTDSLYASPSEITGAGTIVTRGLTADGAIVFDSTHGHKQSFMWQNVTVNLDLSSGMGELGAGYSGTGMLEIKDGLSIAAGTGYIGYKPGSTGTVIVDGSGSNWTVSNLHVARNGSGSLSIINGGSVSAGATYVARDVPALSGSIHFGASGTLTTTSLYVSPSQVSGAGTIHAGGIVTDDDLLFDGTHGLIHAIYWKSPERNVTITVNASMGGDLGAGYYGNGSLVIRDGLRVTSQAGHLGYQSSASGSAEVRGAQSTWTLTESLYVGRNGAGALAILDGGKVTNSGFSYLGQSAGSNGDAIVKGHGSTWISNTHYVGYLGQGTVLVTDGANVTTSKAVSIGVSDTGGGGITIRGVHSAWDISGALTVGQAGTGAVEISNGGSLSSQYTVLGDYGSGSGRVLVDGSGSLWKLSGSLRVGNNGFGNLMIINGGQLTTDHPLSMNVIACFVGSSGVVTVDGSGSSWSGSTYIYVGQLGEGRLVITNRGSVTADSLFIGQSASLLSMSVGDSSLLSLTNQFINSGTLRLLAAPSSVPGTSYSPIITRTWSGTGAVQPLGGTWNTTSHTFTVSPLAAGSAGQPVSIDRSQYQRLQITDADSGRSAIINVLPTTTADNLTLTAGSLTPDQRAALQSAISPATAIVSGWAFAAVGYASNAPAFLSLSIGPGFKNRDLSLWRFEGSSWSSFSAEDLSYDGTYASFAATGFAPFAITLAALHGDSNCDGTVDAFDLNLLAAHWQQRSAAFWADGDFNADGKVDAFDLNLLAGNWQASATLSGASASVPEPASIIFLASAAGMLLLRRRRAGVLS